MADNIKIDSHNIASVLHGGLHIGKPYSQQIYLIDAHIAGTSYVSYIDEIEPQLTLGKRLKFLREPENPYDELAILVCDDQNRKLG